MTSTFQCEFYCISLNDNIGTFDCSIFHPLFDVPLKLHAKEAKQKRKQLLVRLLLPSVLKEIILVRMFFFCSLLDVWALNSLGLANSFTELL